MLDDVTDTLDGLDTGDLLKGDLLNVDVNVDLDADLAAPINGAVAANANVAAPIDAAVAANILSEDSEADGDRPAGRDHHPDDHGQRRGDLGPGLGHRPVVGRAGRHRHCVDRRRQPDRPSGAAPAVEAATEEPVGTADEPSTADRGPRPHAADDTDPAVTTLVDAPARVDGVQLIGEMAGSGYRTPPALVRRSDGQVLQLTPLLYMVLEAVDGRRSYAEIAEVVGRAHRRSVTEDQVQTLVDDHLRPLGLLQQRRRVASPELRRTDPLLAWPGSRSPTRGTTHRLTDPFRFALPAAWCGWSSSASSPCVGWVFFERGLGASAYDAFERPHLLLLVFVGVGALRRLPRVRARRGRPLQRRRARRHGRRALPGVAGVLHRRHRQLPARAGGPDPHRPRRSLLQRHRRRRSPSSGGGATGWEALLLLVATQVLQMVQQLLPLLRFDGYHVLADLAGVPDLYHRIRPTLLGLLPHRWRIPENRVLKPWARVVITLWVLVTIPMMALMLLALVAAVPRLIGSAGSRGARGRSSLGEPGGAGGCLDVAATSSRCWAWCCRRWPAR